MAVLVFVPRSVCIHFPSSAHDQPGGPRHIDLCSPDPDLCIVIVGMRAIMHPSMTLLVGCILRRIPCQLDFREERNVDKTQLSYSFLDGIFGPSGMSGSPSCWLWPPHRPHSFQECICYFPCEGEASTIWIVHALTSSLQSPKLDG
jgi:hypothetical protein